MKTKTLLTALAATATLAIGSAHGAVIQQTNANFSSGTTNYGQRFEVESTSFSIDQKLESVTFFYAGQTLTNRWLDIYAIGTETDGTQNFSSGTGTAGLAFLGSSDSAMTFSGLSLNDPMTWTFTDVTLPRDTPLFAVLSSTNGAGGFASNRLRGTGGEAFVNITDPNTGALFGGTVSPNEDNRYSIEVSDVPEPGSLALLGLGGLLIARRRR